MAQYFYSGIVVLVATDRIVRRFQGVISGDSGSSTLMHEAAAWQIEGAVESGVFKTDELFAHIQQFNKV